MGTLTTLDLRSLRELDLSSLTVDELLGLESLLTSPQETRSKEQAEAEKRLRNREKVARHRAAQREIGEIPPVVDPGLRAACDASLEMFLKTCFPDIFHLPFSDAHRELITEIERVVHEGGNQAYACERGFGKTQLSIGSCVWGALTGRVQYAMIIGANSDMATAQRGGIQRRLETSEPLFNLYPEICYPMRVLAGSLKMSATYNGQLVRIRTRPDLVLPYIPGAPGSEAVISCCGIDSGSIRGRNYDRVDGTNVRPQLVMLDDPQDDVTARQPKEVQSRSKRIRQAISGVAGPGAKLSMLMPCTVIVKNDLAYEFTDRSQRPEWAGKRVPAMRRLPDDLQAEKPLWYVYDELRREDLAIGDKERRRATEFYLANKVAMSAGAVITWPERVEKRCVDALQSLMDKYLTDRMSFMAEQQQDPAGEEDLSIYLSIREIAERYNNLVRGQLPPDVVCVTTGIDVQEHLLYWLQIAWSQSLSGWITSYGHFPPQPTPDFHHLQPPRTIRQWVAKEFPKQRFTWEEQLQLAIRACVDTLPKYTAAPGPVLIDAQWHKTAVPIATICSEAEFAGLLIPAGGQSVGGNDVAISVRKMGDSAFRVSTDVEWYWKRESGRPKKVLFDSNYYRSQLHKGLAAEPGTPGSITYNGRVADAVLANHLGAKSVKHSVNTKREIEIWTNKPGQDQDHWLDCAVMARVAVEVAGFRSSGHRHAKASKRRPRITQQTVNALRKAR